jgi:hypothetical protein
MKRAERQIFVLFLVILCAGVFLMACSKNVAGPKGDPGTPGKNGNTDQATTAVVELSSDAWSVLPTNTADQWQATIFVEAISKEVLSNGEVQVYILKDNFWWALP